MSITITSLTHPTMIAKIRKAMYFAHKGQGHKMNGHGNRVYIQNAKGHNIMRLNWIGGKAGYIVYGSESRDITATVKAALFEAKRRDFALSYQVELDDKFSEWDANKAKGEQLGKLATIVGLGITLAGCQAPGVATAMFSILTGLFT